MKNVYIHIGSEKTGSTFIQETLLANIEQLDRNDLYYCREAFKYANHMELCSVAISDQLLRHVEKPFNVDKFKSNLQFEILNCGKENILISNEHLSSRIVEKSQIESLLSFIKSIVQCNIFIICYYRNPEDWVKSQYKQFIRSGGHLTFCEYYYSQHPADISTLSYIKPIQLWANSDLVEELFFINYDLNKSSIVTILLERIFKVDVTLKYKKMPSNESLNDVMIYLIRIMHKIGVSRIITRKISKLSRFFNMNFSLFEVNEQNLIHEFKNNQSKYIEQLSINEKVTSL